MVYALQRIMSISRPIEEVFSFFADAVNLQRLTPPELSFRILTPLPIKIQVGTMIDYQLQLYGLPFSWRTLITDWNPPVGFIDEQLKGPYRFWRHRHSFRDIAGATEMTDQVEYSLPFPPFGELARPLVRKQLERIFDFRELQIQEIFS